MKKFPKFQQKSGEGRKEIKNQRQKGKEEKKERMLRADPLDGLRPLRRVRKNF